MELKKKHITLGQYLQIIGIASSGGEAKHLIAELEISVNSEPENRRGRKLYDGDVVVIESQEYIVGHES